ncbi:hypothetical protein L7F22_015220 [Adiantum nelumboides]|nr:hypothetical protein [Adiantum nelumboides]
MRSALMKRRREVEEVPISSDSEDGQGSEEDWKEDTDDTDEDDIDNEDDDEDMIDYDDDDDDDEDDDESDDDDKDEDYDDDSSEDDSDSLSDDENDYNDDEDIHSSSSEQHLGSKAKRRGTSGIKGPKLAQQGLKRTAPERALVLLSRPQACPRAAPVLLPRPRPAPEAVLVLLLRPRAAVVDSAEEELVREDPAHLPAAQHGEFLSHDSSSIQAADAPPVAAKLLFRTPSVCERRFWNGGSCKLSIQDRTRQKHEGTKGSRRVRCKTTLTKEDERFFSEALGLIRKGDQKKLKLEHCKAYLRHYSLRLGGSKLVLFDRVQEHIGLKAHGGAVKYPRSTFTIDCTGDACTGDVVLFKQKVKRNYHNPGTNVILPQVGKRIVAGRIVKESYGSDKQQHTFTVEVLWSNGPKKLPFLYPLLIKGRNLYRFRTFRQPWPNEEERKRALQEKHSRGAVARNARECRVSGKGFSCPRRTLVQKSSTRVTLTRKSKADTSYRERSTTSTVRSFVRDHNNRLQKSHRTLTIKACYAGIFIGTQGRNIGVLRRESGAQVQVRDHPSSPKLRLVEIDGAIDQVQVATQMVMQSFLSKGLPAPVETT